MILTVVIPCYNHGIYLQDAIDSVLTYQDQPIEIIIVDDGSTDDYTIKKIDDLKHEGFNIIRHKNSGLAFSRNAGITVARGKYILPLDADNKIKAEYIRKALPILENNVADIVYAKPTFFGEVTPERIFETKEFDGVDLIFGNYIDACAIYRKEVWIKNKGYDENMPYQGVEDWDFWLNSYSNGFNFMFVNEVLYEYRILANSMITSFNIANKNTPTVKYIINKYDNFILEKFYHHYHNSKLYSYDIDHPIRSIFKYLLRALGLNK
jgi:glycosyltransferase involved in cell wall biosynthesis